MCSKVMELLQWQCTVQCQRGSQVQKPESPCPFWSRCSLYKGNTLYMAMPAGLDISCSAAHHCCCVYRLIEHIHTHRNKQTDRQVCIQTVRRTGKQTTEAPVPSFLYIDYLSTDADRGREADRQANKQTDKHLDRQAGRQVFRQADRHLDRQTGGQADHLFRQTFR